MACKAPQKSTKLRSIAAIRKGGGIRLMGVTSFRIEHAMFRIGKALSRKHDVSPRLRFARTGSRIAKSECNDSSGMTVWGGLAADRAQQALYIEPGISPLWHVDFIGS